MHIPTLCTDSKFKVLILPNAQLITGFIICHLMSGLCIRQSFK